MAPSDRISESISKLKKEDVRYVRFELPDTHGTSRSKVVPIEKVEGYARRGLNFYGGIIALDSAAGVVGGSGLHEEIKYRDQKLIPDFDTLQILPWVPGTSKVICDAEWGPNDPVKGSPRYVFKSLVAQAANMGYEVMTGHEFEYYLLNGETREPLFGGFQIFNSTRNNYVPFLDEVLDHLQAVGVDVITHNCEYSPAQFETNFGPAIGVAAADKAFTFKNAMKELAHRAGYLATFMAKPSADMSGCGCHVHMTLLGKNAGKSAFHDPKASDGMSELSKHFTQGILDHADALVAICNPTPNCYRRLKPHTFAPSNVGWAIDDRTAMVRIKDTENENAHVEMRAASSLSNPYLSAAAMLAAGLLGIKAKRAPQPQVDGPSEMNADLPKLPQNLGAALEGLEADAEMRAMLGEDFVHVFTSVKRFELARFNNHVTDWERDEYLEVY
ncbi:MAG: glutamine synthetase family protein [Gammaproteobacteria bacterium]|nr:glutamine synthetase family protein [Gammaproteobacteria bacterium]